MAPLSQPKTTAASVVSYYLALRDLRLTTTAARQTLVNAQSARVVNLAAAGQAGVERALDLMRAELERDMRLMGRNSIAELTRGNLRFR